MKARQAMWLIFAGFAVGSKDYELFLEAKKELEESMEDE